MFCWPCISIDPCNENQLDAPFIASLFATQLLHVSGIFVAHHQEVYSIHNTYKLLYIYSIPLDDGLQICPKHVEVDWRNKLAINSASSWFSLNEF